MDYVQTLFQPYKSAVCHNPLFIKDKQQSFKFLHVPFQESEHRSLLLPGTLEF